MIEVGPVGSRGDSVAGLQRLGHSWTDLDHCSRKVAAGNPVGSRDFSRNVLPVGRVQRDTLDFGQDVGVSDLGRGMFGYSHFVVVDY